MSHRVSNIQPGHTSKRGSNPRSSGFAKPASPTSGSRRRGKSGRKRRRQQRSPYPSPSSSFLKPPAPSRRAGRSRGKGSAGPSRKNKRSKYNAPPPTPDSFEVRSLVSGSMIGGIIGKKGSTVEVYRERSGAHISISKAVPGVPERVLTFSGPGPKVRAAVGLIVANVAAQCLGSTASGVSAESDRGIAAASVERSMQSSSTTTSDPTPNESNEGAAPPPGTLIRSDSGDADTFGLGIFEFCLLVANSDVGAVIGKKGAEVENMRKVSGARIKISDDIVPGTQEKSVVVTGGEQQVLSAVDMAVAALEAHHIRRCNKTLSPSLMPSAATAMPPRLALLPFQTPYYLRTPRPGAPRIPTAYYMSTPKTEGGADRKTPGVDPSEDRLGAEGGPDDETLAEGEVYLDDADIRDVKDIIVPGGQVFNDPSPGDSPDFDDADLDETDPKNDNPSTPRAAAFNADALVLQMRDADYGRKLDAIRQVAEVTQADKIQALVDAGAISALCQLLSPHITPPKEDILSRALKAVSNFLAADGKGDGKAPSGDGTSTNAKSFLESGGVRLVEQLHSHTSVDVYNRAAHVLARFPDRGREDMFPKSRWERRT